MSRIDFWNKRWASNNLGWHRTQVNKRLQEFSNELLLGKSGRRVFVPLCGKTTDIFWLYKEGHTVVGVDAVEQAALDFFKEHELSYEESTCKVNGSKVFKTPDGKISLFISDLFTLNAEAYEGKFDAVWDRWSLVAIYPEDRAQYVSLMKSLVNPEYRILLEAVEYGEDEVFKGPPRRITEQYVKELYGASVHVETLASDDVSEETHVRQRWGVKGPCHLRFILLRPNK